MIKYSKNIVWETFTQDTENRSIKVFGISRTNRSGLWGKIVCSFCGKEVKNTEPCFVVSKEGNKERYPSYPEGYCSYHPNCVLSKDLEEFKFLRIIHLLEQ